MQHRRAVAGFTLIELIVTVVLMAILLALAFPSFATWVRNSQVRTVSDALQNGLRLAQTEALRRNRQVVFTLTNEAANGSTHTATANGKNWAINTVEPLNKDQVAFIESGVLASVAAKVQISGPAALCFNSMGRLVANATPGITGAKCDLPTTSPAVAGFDIGMADPVAGADRSLRVTVALGGQVRLCDPARTLSDDTPDGCPTP